MLSIVKSWQQKSESQGGAVKEGGEQPPQYIASKLVLGQHRSQKMYVRIGSRHAVHASEEGKIVHINVHLKSAGDTTGRKRMSLKGAVSSVHIGTGSHDFPGPEWRRLPSLRPPSKIMGSKKMEKKNRRRRISGGHDDGGGGDDDDDENDELEKEEDGVGEEEANLWRRVS